MFEMSSELQPRTLRVSRQRWRVPNIAPGAPHSGSLTAPPITCIGHAQPMSNTGTRRCPNTHDATAKAA